MQELTLNQSENLVVILATEDALWRPFRWQYGLEDTAAPEIFHRRRQFGRAGVPFVVGGSIAHRLAGRKELADMSERGLIVEHHDRKRIGVSLTREGRDTASALAGAYSRREAWFVLRQLQQAEQLLEADYQLPQFPWVPEPALVGATDWSDEIGGELGWLEQVAAPLLAEQLIETYSDSSGRIAYRRTDAGVAATGKRKERVRKGLPGFDGRLANLYDAIYGAQCEERLTWRHGDNCLIQMPFVGRPWPTINRRSVRHG